MSGSNSNIEYIDNGQTVSFKQESAGYIWGAVVVIFKAISPYLVAAAKGALIGSAVSAGAAYLGGARGGDVWRAAGMGALGGAITGGLGAIGSAGSGAAGAATAPTTAVANTAGAVPGAAGTSLGAGMGGSVASMGATAAVSPTLTSSITSMFGNLSGEMVNRIGSAIINAAVNGQSMGRMDGLVAQQRAELQALAARDRSAYEQKISVAQKVLADADRMDPEWWANVKMADVAGMEANQFRQAMRNIAVRQGGSLDTGQRKAYERGAALHTARSKALVRNKAWVDASVAQQQMRASGAQLLGPDIAGFQNWQAETGLLADQERAKHELNASTWGGLTSAFTEGGYSGAQSPDPSSNDDDDEEGTAFQSGFNWPNGRR